MQGNLILLWTGLAIGIILILILKFKLNAAIAMFVGAMFVGIASGVGMAPTVAAISTGFGNTMRGMGLSIGFGVMLGQLVADTGAVQTIAKKMLNAFGEKRSDYAMGATGFVVSIPVFYDVGFVILTPLAKILAKDSTQKILPHFVGSLVAGLGIAHTFIPPTPGPMTGGELLGVPTGITILAGLAIGIPTFILTMVIYDKFFLSRKNFWNEDCLEYDPAAEAEAAARQAALIKDEKSLPGFGIATLPILLPIVMILTGTIWGAIVGKNAEGISLVPDFIQMISTKEVAMICGVAAALLLAQGRLTGKQIEGSISKSLGATGTVLLITGLGGGLGQVLSVAGVGEVLKTLVTTINVPIILFVWLIAALLKIAQGSGTVAMVTALSIVATMGSLGVHPALLALAGFSGSLCGAHVNDSAFWVTTKMSGLSTMGGLKTYTLVCFIESILSLGFIYIASIFIR